MLGLGAPPALKEDCSGEWWNRGVQHYPPADPRDYSNALAFLARRYGPAVAGWEIWNEPNSSFYFRSAHPASAYAALLKSAYRAVKGADPGAKVVGGALSGADAEFTRALYANGIRGYFDAFSIHPYSGDRSPLDRLSTKWASDSYARGVPLVHRVMIDNGDAKPLWLTEVGWSTCSARSQAQSWQSCVDQSVQARYLKLAFGQLAAWPFVRACFWYDNQDLSSDSGDVQSNFGLTQFDGDRKPAYYAFREAAAGSLRARLRDIHVRAQGRRLTITGRISTQAQEPVRVELTSAKFARHAPKSVRVRPRAGFFSTKIRVARSDKPGRNAELLVTYPGDSLVRPGAHQATRAVGGLTYYDRSRVRRWPRTDGRAATA